MGEADKTTEGTGAWPGEWLNPPASWSVEADGALRAASRDRTDFWQATYYGFRRDDGHALLLPVVGDFSATLVFSGDYRELYDQAGLMLRAGPEAWVKFGIEWTDGMAHLSVVGTRDGMSDWSAVPLELDGPVTLRATQLQQALLLQWSRDSGESWAMVRLLPVPIATDAPAGNSIHIGPYLCSPERAGFVARFHTLAVSQPLVLDLHE